MKTIGLLGGMSWESTAEYYRIINQGVKLKLGGFHSARIVLYSVDFSQIEQMQKEGDWTGMADLLSVAAGKLQAAGADFFLICTNTMHKVAPEVATSVKIPFLHIADAAGEVLQRDGIKKVGLLGTSFTMEHDFYKGRLNREFGLEVVVPDMKDRKIIHDTIFNELCLGHINEESRLEFVRIINSLENDGAEAIILGCTEIGLLVKQDDVSAVLYDTTEIHAKKAVEYAV